MDIGFGERRLRSAVHHRLLRATKSVAGTLVVDELGVLNGRGRIDIAVINGHIRGIELKSDGDTLNRLPLQVASYGCVVDQATLVADDRWVEKALAILPAWWGVVSAAPAKKGGFHFKRVRVERANLEQRAQDIARLLWKQEAVDLLERLTGRFDWQRKRRVELYETLPAYLSLRTLKREVREALKSRVTWRDRQPPV